MADNGLANAQMAQMMANLQAQLDQLQLAVAERDNAIQQLQQNLAQAAQVAQQAQAAAAGAQQDAANVAQQAQAAAAAVAQQAQAAVAAAQQAQAAAGAAAPAAAVAAPAAAPHKVKVPYTKLGLVPKTTQLNMTLDNWFTATRACFAVNGVPSAEEVQVAVLAAMEGHVQAVCLEMLRANMLTSWEQLKEALQLNFSQQDRKQAAATELEQLTMLGDSKAALETYISKSRALHLVTGNEITELQKYRYFMRGMEKGLRELVSGLIAASGHSETFEYASNLALKIMATRQETLRNAASSSAGPMPMELMAMNNGGWRPQSRPFRPGKAGGSRASKPIKGKGRLPGKWKPRMNNQERKALMRANLCLCCRASTDHTWRDCPKNPDNRGNA